MERETTNRERDDDHEQRSKERDEMTRDEAYWEAGNMNVDRYDGMLINRLIGHLLDEVGRLEAIATRQEKQIKALAGKVLS